MENKQEEDISGLFLWGATILYIAILCMSFAGLAVTKPTVGAAFLDFTKDYGSLLAGIPVLIAVLVAKQQLDANRRQHVATVKRGLRSEIEALDLANTLVRRILSAKIESDDLFSRILNSVNIPRPTPEDLKQLDGRLPTSIHKMLTTIAGDIDGLNQRTVETEGKRRKAEEELEDLKDDTREILAEVKNHYAYLSQYWS